MRTRGRRAGPGRGAPAEGAVYARRPPREGSGQVHTAEGTVIDTTALRARRPWPARRAVDPDGPQGGDGRRPPSPSACSGSPPRGRRSTAGAAADDVVASAAPLPPRRPGALRRPRRRRRRRLDRSSCCRPRAPAAAPALRRRPAARPANGWPRSPAPTSAPTAAAAVDTIAEELPRVHGLRRGGAREQPAGTPVGAAYLRRASERMRTLILPAATAVYEDAAAELERSLPRRHAAVGRDGRGGRRRGLAVLAIVLAQLFVTCAQPTLAQRRAAGRRGRGRRRGRGDVRSCSAVRPTRWPSRATTGATSSRRCRRRGS